MSKARQSKRQRYRKPRADYQAGGRVNVRSGGRGPARLTDDRARGGRKIPNRKVTTSRTITPSEGLGELGAMTDDAATTQSPANEVTTQNPQNVQATQSENTETQTTTTPVETTKNNESNENNSSEEGTNQTMSTTSNTTQKINPETG